MPPFKAILFDLGNTLLYFNSRWPSIFTQADNALYDYLSSAGVTLERQAFTGEFRQRMHAYYQQRELDLIEYTSRQVLKTLLADKGYPDIPEAQIKAALRSLYAVSQEHWQLEEDTHPMLEALRQQGYCMGIISNASDDDDVQKLVDQSDLRQYFDFVISSAAYGLRKPSPEIFGHALSHWQVTPQQVVMVGDTVNADILGAQRSGIFSVWITRRAAASNRKLAATIQPDAQIATLAELPDLLKSVTPPS